ncbi:hypothetical protein KKJ00_12485, partial [Xenorhabdus bovienii]|nr:hypothetical protein [Xenorhabdus bovienii]
TQYGIRRVHPKAAFITCCLNSTFNLHEKWGDYPPKERHCPRKDGTDTLLFYRDEPVTKMYPDIRIFFHLHIPPHLNNGRPWGELWSPL